MKRLPFILLLAVLVFGQKKATKDLTDPEIEVTETAVRREENRITVDGRLKNTGEKPAKNLSIYYEILDSDKNVLLRQKGGIDGRNLDPEQEAEIHAQMHFHARAVFVRLEFEDGSGRELKATNAGPFAIE